MAAMLKTSKRVDWVIIVLYLTLVTMGWFSIFSATYEPNTTDFTRFAHSYVKQIIWIGLALTLALLAVQIDTKFYSVFSFYIYGLAMLLLVIVLFVGTKVNGARSWFELGGFRLQPAEFAKLGTTLAIARILSGYGVNLRSRQTILKLLAIVVVPFLLIIKQNDTGSALVYASFLLVFYREGMPGEFLLIGTSLIILFISVLLSSLLYVEIGVLIFVLLIFFIIQRDLRTLLIATSIITLLIALVWAASYFTKLNWALENIIAICSIVSILAFWIWAFRRRLRYIYFLLFFAFSAISFSYSVNYFFQNMLGTHQQNRINVLLGIETDPRGIGYNVHQSKVAIGSGGLSGKGFLEGTQNKGSFVPEQSTDFIFCTIGEEWGFIGSTFVLLVFGAFIARTIQLAERQRSTFSRVYGYSVASIIFFHLFVNIGMTIGLMPVIGIPLPFFSYGGSSLIAFTILVFIFIRLDTSRDEIL